MNDLECNFTSATHRGRSGSAVAFVLATALAICSCGSETTIVTPAADGGAVASMDGGTVANADGGSSSEDGGTTSADGGAPDPDDPCAGITNQGVCQSTTVLKVCEFPSEGGRSRLLTQTCAAGEACQVENGKAGCVLTAACRNDDVECQDANTLRTCTSNTWVPTACPNGCIPAPVGASCGSGVATQMISTSVVFERRDINAGRNALGDMTTSPARGFTVTVHRGSSLIATTTTGTDGTFSVGLPSTLTAGDVVRVAAVAAEGNGIAYAVADPGLPAGAQDTNRVSALTTPPRVWSWEFAANTVTAGTPLTITTQGGSSQAANVFDKFGATYRDMKTRYGRAGVPILIWMGNGVAWDCGACVGEGDANFFGTRFEQQMWYPIDNNQSAYSDPVIQHEAGHWVMSAFGRSPGEGGGHSLACASFPGLAWSDGFATWLGQVMVGNPIYFDIQGGLFWYDISARTSNGEASNWPARPSPNNPDVGTSAARGVLQKMSEGEVTAILYALSNGPADPAPVLTALATPRMKQPAANGRFERGYTRRLWQFNQASCTDSNVRDLGEAAPILPDLLDAMRCANFPADRMDAATLPAQYYPFPSASPLCR